MQRVTTLPRDALLPVAGRMRRREWEMTDDTILIFQPDHLGDILLSQPAVQHLRDQHPNSQLVAVVGPWSREIAAMAWPVDEVITIAFPGFTRTPAGSPIAPYRQLRVEARRLERFRSKTAYVLRPDAWWAAWLASLIAPEVVAADVQRSREFATSVTPISDDEHSVVRAWRIASSRASAALPTLTSSPLGLPVAPEAVRDAAQLLLDHGVTNHYLVIHPGSGASVKEWPAQRWRAVADALSGDNVRVVLTGGPGEVDLCAVIADTIPRSVTLAGKTTVPVLAEVLRGACIALGPDCGPLHLAVAVGTPTVHLFGPSDPRRYGPWGDPARHRVISAGWRCPRCGDLSSQRAAGCGCMLAIQPDEVIEIARLVLSNHAR